MKKLMLIKEVNIKTLVSGDKSARIILESLSPDDIDELSMLSSLVEVWVTFDKDNKKA